MEGFGKPMEVHPVPWKLPWKLPLPLPRKLPPANSTEASSFHGSGSFHGRCGSFHHFREGFLLLPWKLPPPP